MRALTLLFHDVYTADPSESGFRSDAADRYKLRADDFMAQIEGVAQVRADAPLLAGGLSSVSGGHTPFLVTVDDGGISYYTHIAEALERHGWRGHCFVSTDYIGTRGFLDAAQIRELDRRGHLIGSHSASHPPRISACRFDQIVREWRRSRARLEDILGHRVSAGSVPGGYFSPDVARAARVAGLDVLFTSEPLSTIVPGPDCTLIGRFTIRHGDRPDAAQRFVMPAPWARSGAWLSWNAKGLVKPLLGPSYRRVSDWLHSVRASRSRPDVNGALGRTS
jgi:peptidoglycan/xylan/chitin deacetylase (PgdA/CDA1 family)